MTYATFILRAETKPHERRSPLTPTDARRLIELSSARFLVESSAERVFPDEEFRAVGAEIVPAGTWGVAGKGALVLGLKELPAGSRPIFADHIYFSHSYRGQAGAAALRQRFTEGGSQLYDLEFLRDPRGQRLAAFGYWAGYVGAALGLLDYFGALQGPLIPYRTKNELLARLSALQSRSTKAPRVAVTGALGRAGRGAMDLLLNLGLNPLGIDLHNGGRMPEALEHEILVHCVGAPNAQTTPILRNANPSTRRNLKHLVDVTCDFTSDFHLFPFYREGTSLAEPVRDLQGLRLVAIDHLPTLLPRESSAEFSAQLQPQLLALLTASPRQLPPEWRSATPEVNV